MSFAGGTLPEGYARLTARWCGRARLLIAASVLNDPADIELFEGPAAMHNLGMACTPRFVRSVHGADRFVEFALDCQNGCYSTWRVHMQQRADQWRVRGFRSALTTAHLDQTQQAKI